MVKEDKRKFPKYKPGGYGFCDSNDIDICYTYRNKQKCPRTCNYAKKMEQKEKGLALN